MDGDMNDILQKFNNILEDKDMSNNLKNILNNFSSSNSSNNSSESTNTTNINTDYNNDSSEKKSNNGIPEFDINTILKLTYNNKMVGFQEFDPYDGINIAYNKAIHDNKLGYFYYHKNYIDDLFNYVKTKLFINHVLSDINIKITKAKRLLIEDKT